MQVFTALWGAMVPGTCASGRGYGWSDVQIDSIVVAADSIPVVYGISTIPEFTGQPCRAKECSATDFILTRTGDLPK